MVNPESKNDNLKISTKTWTGLFKVTEFFINGCKTGNRTEETEMNSGEIIEFEKDWKKLWHPKMNQGKLTNL